tara:strand:- start:4405 stop:4668 length:264 start_codon:yes stop_codon:yes gene_type:complete
MIKVNILFSGKIQGVGFRYGLKRKSKQLGIKGYVKNLDDGKVEAVLEGDDEKIEKVLDHCKKIFDVENIEIKEEGYKNEFEDFKILK